MPAGNSGVAASPGESHAEIQTVQPRMREMNESEKELTGALRGLREKGPQGAPRALGEMLQSEFQRHHARRRKRRAAVMSLIAACAILPVGISKYLRKADLPAM